MPDGTGGGTASHQEVLAVLVAADSDGISEEEIRNKVNDDVAAPLQRLVDSGWIGRVKRDSEEYYELSPLANWFRSLEG